MGDLGSIPGLGRSPGGRHVNPLQYSCLENPHGKRSLEGYSPWDLKESDKTERLGTAHTYIYMYPTIPKEKKCKKAQWLSEETLQIAEKRKEAKSKGEKERYTHLNAQFQRIARRDKKAFLSDQCKEVEENKRMENTRDLFKKIRDTKGTFHSKMGSIKGRNGMDLTEAEDIKKRWKEYTKELYKKDLHDPDNHNGVITHLEPDILECEVKWALGSVTMNKASGYDGIPVELFQILNDDAVKVLHSICQKI